MSYPISFRRKVITRIEEGMSKREAARLFKLSPNTIYLWLNSPDFNPLEQSFGAMKNEEKVCL